MPFDKSPTKLGWPLHRHARRLVAERETALGEQDTAEQRWAAQLEVEQRRRENERADWERQREVQTCSPFHMSQLTVVPPDCIIFLFCFGRRWENESCIFLHF